MSLTDGTRGPDDKRPTRFRLTVTYAAGHDQRHDGLDDEQVLTAVGAFTFALVGLKGRGIKRLIVEIDGPRNEATLKKKRQTANQRKRARKEHALLERVRDLLTQTSGSPAEAFAEIARLLNPDYPGPRGHETITTQETA